MASSSSSSSSSSLPPPPPLASIPTDIIQTHILSRLDGPSLASFSCASTDFLSLSSDDRLWKSICAASWPSTALHTNLRHVIADFPHGHRSFFSDSHAPFSSSSACTPQQPTTKLISAVDIFYRGAPLFSKVLETETVTPWFMSAPFNIDLIEQVRPVPTPIPNSGQKDDTVLRHLEENLGVSWIVVDPAAKRSGSVCGTRPVSVERHWISGDIQVEYSAVVDVDWKDAAWPSEAVLCRVTVVLCGGGGGLMEVKEVSMRVEDLDGRGVNGEDSLLILVGAVRGGERRRAAEGRVADFGEMKRTRRERKVRREKALDVACTFGGAAIFVILCMWLRTFFS